MPLTPLTPVVPPGRTNPRWSFAASTALHVVVIILVIGIAAWQPRLPAAGEPSYELIFDSPAAPPGQGLPPIQPADVPAPDDAPLGNPAPAALSPPRPDGAATPQPEAAASATASSAPTPEPPEATNTPAPSVSPPTQLAFASPAEPAITPAPAPPEVPPNEAAPSVNLQLQSDDADLRAAPLDLPPIMPQPPPPLPQPSPPRPRPPSRQALGTLSNPMDLSLAPAPRPTARGSVASRAIDLSPPAERQGPSRSDPYAQIRSANASEDWNRGLRQYWLQHRFYPPQAAQNGEEGTVTIQLTVDRSGRVEDVQVLSRSGSQWLDMAAVSTWRNARLPPFTNEMRQDRLTFPIPITYYLVRR